MAAIPVPGVISPLGLAWLFVLGYVLIGIAIWVAATWAVRRVVPEQAILARAVLRRTRAASAFIIPFLTVLILLPETPVARPLLMRIERIVGVGTIAAIAWAAVVLVKIFADVTLARHRIDVEDNLLARRTETRVRILTRVSITLISLVAAAAILMTIPAVRTIGATLLASAGIAGVVAGLAARPIFENLVAGVQIALTQPIRIDDVVIVENEMGNVEEITSTYVVVRLWDLRRMVLPLTYFINTPFQNWTRQSAALIGAVLLYTDYDVDVDAVRVELDRILDASPLWDKKTKNVQVTDATEHALQLRILVSASSASRVWDLRCAVREKIAAFLRDHEPGALPRTRIDETGRLGPVVREHR